MNHQELIERLRAFEIDHEPNGWPAIQMRDISAMCDAIESLLNALDVADSEVKRTVADRDELKNKNALLSAHVELYGEEARRLDDLSTDYARRIVHWVEKHDAKKAERDAALAELAKYRDAPVVVWRTHPFDYGIGHEGVYASTHFKEQSEVWKRKGWRVEELIVKPGE